MRKRRPRPRPHFGGRSSVKPSTSVFINCPFDKDYQPLFDAIVFAVTCCGFLARSALESGNVSDLRIYRILNGMFSSRYSIHELSRCHGEGDENIARFNMPLELGIAMARRFGEDGKGGDHDWFILVPKGHTHQKVISDLSGYDPKGHDGSIKDVVTKVISWLTTRPDATISILPREALELLPSFQAAANQLREEWGDDLPWVALVSAATDIAEKAL